MNVTVCTLGACTAQSFFHDCIMPVLKWIGTSISAADSFLWGWPLIVILLGTHLYFTIRLKFIQTYTFKGIRLTLWKDSNASGNVSPLGALSVALASTIGTGNIIGVATAVVCGGPGAVFWCWMTGVFGIATKYAESLIAIKFRVKSADGQVHGGAMYAMENGFRNKTVGKALAVIFCLTLLGSAMLGIGSMTQSNAAATVVSQSFGIPMWCTGLFLMITLGLVILGGLKVIARVCTAVVPFMAAIYVAGCIWILCINHAFVWDALVLIVKSAFTTQAATGGFIGSAVMLAARFGVARGLFSNESGMGSAPIVAASAQTRNPVRQALISSTGTFWDTAVICAMTGITLVSTVLADPSQTMDPLNEDMRGILTQKAFDQIPVIGHFLLAFAIFFFAGTTILGWFFYGEQAIHYLTKSIAVMWAYKILFVLSIFIGTVVTLNVVWDFSDLTNGLTVIPNVIALFVLQKVIVSETEKYLWHGSVDDPDPDFVSGNK